MSNNIYNSKTFKDFLHICTTMYNLGWDERNGGNISVLLSEDEVREYVTDNNNGRILDLSGVDATTLVNRYILVTGSGKYFRNVERCPEENIGIVKILEDGKHAKIIWGLENEAVPTSEFPTHLSNHIVRLGIDPNHKVVIHTHATYTMSLSFVLPEDEDELTRTLWKMQTESIVVFPEGIGYLPWMLCGGKDIGDATANKAKEYRVVIWGQHGVFGMGTSIDEAFGLIETVEKAAQIYFITDGKRVRDITNEQLKLLADTFKVKYKPII